MKTEEARTRWCPFGRISPSDDGPAYNRGERGWSGLSSCIANECMAWRWHTDDDARTRVGGYCGLAGKP